MLSCLLLDVQAINGCLQTARLETCRTRLMTPDTFTQPGSPGSECMHV